MLTMNATKPVTVTKDGVSVVFNKYRVASVVPIIVPGVQIKLVMTFELGRLDDQSAWHASSEPKVNFEIQNALTDASLAAPSAAWFAALAAKAVAAQIL